MDFKIIRQFTVELPWSDAIFPSQLVAISFCCLAAWVSWGIWRFVLSPARDTYAPRELPYLIPWLGHTFSFLRSSEQLLTSARRYFGPCREPFTITIAGSTVYIITDPQDVKTVYNRTDSFSFEGFLADIMTEFGTSRSGVSKILHKGMFDSVDQHLDKETSIGELAHELQSRQTQGANLKSLGRFISSLFEEKLSLESMSNQQRVPLILEQRQYGPVISLKSWTAELFISAGQRAYFGETLHEIDPGLPEALIELDNLSWQIFYQYPRVFRPRLNQICKRVLNALRDYLAIPMDQRPSEAWFTPALEREYRKAGLTEEDIATQMLFLYWGINTNISKVGFWIIAHLLFQPGLMETIREETAPAFAGSGSFDSDFTYRHCPKLNAVWLEALRVSAASTTLRSITQDTVVGGRLLRKGKKLMISARQLHFSSAEYGQNAPDFDPTRFLKNAGLHRNPGFRPFGGGITECPGRFLAKHMVLSFVAIVVRRFDLALATPQVFPRYQENKPSIGITSGEGDLYVNVRERKAVSD